MNIRHEIGRGLSQGIEEDELIVMDFDSQAAIHRSLKEFDELLIFDGEIKGVRHDRAGIFTRS